jgi:hypothetical protein
MAKSKRDKGKRAPKTKIKAAAEEEAVAGQQGGDDESSPLDSKMKGLQISEGAETNEDALLEEAIKLAAAEKKELDAAAEKKKAEDRNDERKKCLHGLVPLPGGDICFNFSTTFGSTFCAALKGGNNIAEAFEEARSVTTSKYTEEIWVDPIKMKCVLQICLREGTRTILDGDDVRFFVVTASYFEQYIDRVILEKNQDTLNLIKLLELFAADEHTLVNFFRKRIPCSCLDEKYEEVKSISKIGMCCNVQCSKLLVERNTMVYCTLCRRANYCSRECQIDAWKGHKKDCRKHAAKRAQNNSHDVC